MGQRFSAILPMSRIVWARGRGTRCCVRGWAQARAYSIPGLKELGSIKLSTLDTTRDHKTQLSHALVIFSGGQAPSENRHVQRLGARGKHFPQSRDKAYNPPSGKSLLGQRYRTSSGISGTQYVSPTDLDILIGGPPTDHRASACSPPPPRRIVWPRSGGAGAPLAHPARGLPRAGGSIMTRQLE